MIWPVASSAVTFAVFGFILPRARHQSLQLAQMSELLKQIFGRSMSTEVMKPDSRSGRNAAVFG